MAATRYGLGVWGVTSEADKGLYIGDLSLEASEEEAYLPDHIGEDVGLALFNRQARITGSGAVVTGDTQGQTLGGVLSINSTAIYGTDAADITKFYVSQINLRRANRDFQQGGFTAVGRAKISDASGSEVS